MSDATTENEISLRGVRTHNLGGFDLDLPVGQWITLTGVSGSGKTSLAFDTLFAEGQRRYVEQFPAYIKRFLPRLDRADLEEAVGLPPALAVSQEFDFTPNATLASVTGILDYAKILFGRRSRLVCPQCAREITSVGPDSLAMLLRTSHADHSVTIGFSIHSPDSAERSEWIKDLRELGILRVDWDGTLLHLGRDVLPAAKPTKIRGIVDRVIPKSVSENRLWDSLSLANRLGKGTVECQINGEWNLFSVSRECPSCHRRFPELEPNLFSPYSLTGRCQTCSGTGKNVLAGTSKKKSKDALGPCPACFGTQLDPSLQCFRLNEHDWFSFHSMAVDECVDFFKAFDITDALNNAVVKPITARLSYLSRVGLGYLTLNRRLDSLATGEQRRLALTALLGTELSQMLLVLDEPTAGLHSVDTQRLIEVLSELRDAGNTIVVVEHDREMILASDFVVDLGPGAGSAGGKLIHVGSVAGLLEHPTSPTAHYLREKRQLKPTTRPTKRWLTLEGAKANNLRNLTVGFPLDCICVVAGVSGSGKSSLVFDSLLPAWRTSQQATGPMPGQPRLAGQLGLGDVVAVDAGQFGKSPRANPATYLKFFDEIRELFTETTEAKIRGLKASDFSFNQKSGRCSGCEGTGRVSIDMQFLPKVHVTCPDCEGRRFERTILEVKCRGLDISEVLELSADEAFGYFRGEKKILEKLAVLRQVGLGYLPVGQSLDTLSGGEGQRLFLASVLATKSASRTLYLFDEPTIGLHPADTAVLLECFSRLVEVGHSLIVIEHEPLVLRAADYIIEMGPGAGPAGGEVLAVGTPSELAGKNSPTGHVLARFVPYQA